MNCVEAKQRGIRFRISFCVVFVHVQCGQENINYIDFLLQNDHIFVDLSKMKKIPSRRFKCELCNTTTTSGCNTCQKYVCETHWNDYKQLICEN